MSILHVEDLSIQFHDRHAVGEMAGDINFHIEPGEIVGIVGESGSGKSTVMRAIMGLLPEKAEVKCTKILLGQDDITPLGYENGKFNQRKQKLYEKRMESIRGNGIAMIFQDPLTYLNPTMKIGKQVIEAVQVHKKMSLQQAKERAIELLDMAGIRNPRERFKQYPFELSGGMCQRVVLAIAIAGSPRILIADEPTTALDVTVQGQILQLLLRIAKETKMAVLLVSHDLGVIASVCSRVLVMQQGRMIEQGSVEDIFYNPVNEYTKTLISQATGLGTFGAQPHSDDINKPILTVHNVTKLYKEQRFLNTANNREAVKAVSMTIYKGETYGLVGESGCGKTTLAGMIAGIHLPTSGSIEYNGHSLVGMVRQIQMVFQNPHASLNPKMTIQEMLEEPLLLNTQLTAEERIVKVCDIMKLIGLSSNDLSKYPPAFSGGERQRIAIARALMLQPELIVCDEPVASLDVSIQEQILKLLEKIQKEYHNSYVFISHDLNVVKRISHRVGVMYAGSIVEEGNTRAVYEEPWHPYTKSLLAAILTPDPRVARKRRGMMAAVEMRRESVKSGCPYAGKCGYVMACCEKDIPPVYQFDDRKIACFLYDEKHTGRSGTYKMTSQI